MSFSPGTDDFVLPGLVIFDLDGTVYAGDYEIPGAGRFINDCRSHGIAVAFATNRANRPVGDVAAQLRSYGVACHDSDIITSAVAAAEYVGNGRSAFLVGESGLYDAFSEKGIRLDDCRPDCVVVGLDRYFNYEKLSKASSLIRGGAAYIATNTDSVLKLKDGVVPGTGSIVAAVTAASEKEPVVIGKPERWLFDILISRLGAKPDETLVVGDCPSTDIAAANNAGLRSALLLTGVYVDLDSIKPKKKDSPVPTMVCRDYVDLSLRFGFV